MFQEQFAIRSEILKAAAAEVQRIGGTHILYIGAYGSFPKGYSRQGSDVDAFVVYTQGNEIAQQLLFNNSEHFETKPNTGEHPFWYTSSNGTEWQLKLLPIQHFVAQVCGSNYDMLQAVHHPLVELINFSSGLHAMRLQAAMGYDFATVAQSKYRAAFRMAKSLLDSNDFSSNVHDRRMAESTSRLVDGLHAFMTSMIIMHNPDDKNFVIQDYSTLLTAYQALEEQPVDSILIQQLLCMHSKNHDKEKVYQFVKDRMAQQIVDYRPAFDKWSVVKDEARVKARKEFSRLIHTASLEVSKLPFDKNISTDEWLNKALDQKQPTASSDYFNIWAPGKKEEHGGQ